MADTRASEDTNTDILLPAGPTNEVVKETDGTPTTTTEWKHRVYWSTS